VPSVGTFAPKSVGYLSASSSRLASSCARFDAHGDVKDVKGETKMKLSLRAVTISANWDVLKYSSAGALLILGLLVNRPAQADTCIPSLMNFISSGVCAEVSARVDNPTGQQVGEVIPPNTAASPVPVTVSTIAGGGSSGQATATVSASVGVLKLSTEASISNGPLNVAGANASAAFTDIGTVDKLTGTPGNFGDPVHAIVTVSINGTTIGTAGFGSQGTFLDIHNIVSLTDPTAKFPAIVNLDPPFGGSVAGIYEFDTTIGAPISLTLYMSIFAAAGGASGPIFSSADYSHTAALFFDFGTPGFFFNSVSGYDYSSAATAPSETPIPASLPLMASTVAGVLVFARRRRNKQKASA
jgi:hypothetical protein